MYTRVPVCACFVVRSTAWLSKLTAFSMCHSRQITPGRYKGTRRQSKAVVSTGVDSGQPLDLIKAFEPESCSRPPFVTPFQPLLSLAAEGSSLIWPSGEPRKENISARERSKEEEWNSPDLSDIGESVLAAEMKAGSPHLTSNTWPGMQEKSR